MSINPSRFAELLTRAVNRIHANEGKKKTIVRDELGYAAGREGRTAVDYWCRDNGHVPALLASVEGLAREIAQRGGLSREELEAFLVSANHPEPQRLCRELYPAERMNGTVSLSGRSGLIQLSTAQPAADDNAIPASPNEIVPDAEPASQTATKSISESTAVLIRTPARGQTSKIRPIIVLLALVALAVTTAMVWPRLTARTGQVVQGQLQLVAIGEQRVHAEISGRNLLSDEIVPAHAPITVTFRVLNNGVEPLTLRSLAIGARGPGATCHDTNAQRWSALDAPFPAVTGLILQPGQMYEYQGQRSFYVPGTYFLEPVVQDMSGRWGGIPPFTCVDLQVK